MEVKSENDNMIDDTFNCDGYERLHDEIMDQISVSIHSNFEDAFAKCSKSNLVIADVENQVEKKMKISLSQEQLKLNSSKNFLTVPVNVRKARSASFSIADGKAARRNVKIHAVNEVDTLKLSNNLLTVERVKPDTLNDNKDDINEVIYAVPQKHFLRPTTSLCSDVNDVKTSSASLASTKSITLPQMNNEVDFKYPLSFYCKFCNKVLDDPRVLDCLHSFCCQCLAQLDASSDLHNNQFWRKISDSSSYKEPSVQSRSSADSDTIIKSNTPEKKFSLSGSSKSPRKFLSKSSFKDKSPTRNVKGRNSSIISFTDKQKSIICPTCGLTTEMTIHGVYRLPQNTLVARKIKKAIGSNQDTMNTCQLCMFANSNATSICMTCSFKLCTTCKDTHKRHTTNHEIKKLQEKKTKKSSEKPASSNAAVKCLIHSNNDLKLFCTTCCLVICSECTVLIHRGHKMTSIAKASKIYIEMLKDAKDNTKPLTTYAMHSMSRLNDISKKINQKCDAVEQDVVTFLMEYFEALEVHKRTLLHQIARCRDIKMDMLQSHQVDLERRTNEAKAAIAFTENLLSDGTEIESLVLVNMLLRRFDACRSSERALDIKINDSLQFLPEVRAPLNQKNIPLFGIITTQIAVARNCTLESLRGLMNLRVHKKAELVLQTRDNEERAMCHGCADVEVTVYYRDVTFKTLPVYLTDKRDGTYSIIFLPDQPGLLQISITVNGKPIRDSPFTVRARNLRPHSGIFHCCSFCSSNGKKDDDTGVAVRVS
ncbi:hypothetical protein ACKWTF_006167 [Chironomus riparius]